MSWFTISKALLKSRKTPWTYSPSYRDLEILSLSKLKAIVVEWFFLNPNWRLYSTSFWSINSVILPYINLSNSFENTGITDTGLLLTNNFDLPPLYNGITFAIFNSLGKTPWSIDMLDIYTRGSRKHLYVCITILRLISSQPGLVLVISSIWSLLHFR